MRSIFPITVLAAAAMASAWQISGKVTELHSTATTNGAIPIAGAQVCEFGNPSNCASSGADGAFSLTGTGVAVRPSAAEGGISFASAGGRIFLRSDAPAVARLEWFDAGSGRLLASEDLSLAGAGAVTPPASIGSGLRMLRLRAGGAAAEARVLVFGGAAYSVLGEAVGAPLAKTAEAQPCVVAAKAGFKSRRYYAVDLVKDDIAWILLAPESDDTTYKEPGTSYAAMAVPPNEITGVAKPGGGRGYAYGGGKVNNLLGHAAAGKGTMTFKKIYAPADGNYDVTWSYYCGKDDNNGDKDCGGEKDILTPSGCRPGILVINGTELPKVYQFKCFHEGWDVIHFVKFPLPLKAGNDNSIHIYSKTADVADLDRIIVGDGRVY